MFEFFIAQQTAQQQLVMIPTTDETVTIDIDDTTPLKNPMVKKH